MYNKDARVMMLYTMTPTHAGSGTQLSYVDLPIQRESHTGFPKIEASTLKGCIRCAAGDTAPGEESSNQTAVINRIFGSPGSGDFASAVSFTDARLLFFPVKSAIGIFAWITCPYVIRRFLEDYSITAGGSAPEIDLSKAVFPEDAEVAFCPSRQTCALKADGKGAVSGDRIMLEDYVYGLKENPSFGKLLNWLAERLPGEAVGEAEFRNHAVLVSDDDFCQFVKYSTEVSTRIKINPDTGTVDGKALFTEEFLPPESILYSVVIFGASHLSQKEAVGEARMTASEVRDAFFKIFKKVDIFQIGSDSTLGKGLVKKAFWEVD